MKKLLKIIVALSLVTSASMTTISCFNEKKIINQKQENDDENEVKMNKYKEENIIEFSKISSENNNNKNEIEKVSKIHDVVNNVINDVVSYSYKELKALLLTFYISPNRLKKIINEEVKDVYSKGIQTLKNINNLVKNTENIRNAMNIIKEKSLIVLNKGIGLLVYICNNPQSVIKTIEKVKNVGDKMNEVYKIVDKVKGTCIFISKITREIYRNKSEIYTILRQIVPSMIKKAINEPSKFIKESKYIIKIIFDNSFNNCYYECDNSEYEC